MSPSDLYDYPWTAKLLSPVPLPDEGPARPADVRDVITILRRLRDWPAESARNAGEGATFRPHDAVAASPAIRVWLTAPPYAQAVSALLAEIGVSEIEEASGLSRPEGDLLVFYRRDDAAPRTERSAVVWGHIVGIFV